MSVKQRVFDITVATATQVARALIETRMRQLQQSLSTMSKVTKVNGNQITLSMPDGSLKTVPNLGSRIVGPGDPMLTDGSHYAL